jgi:hypothetical protein|tara:strand:- start:14800 stop:15171 length:372 start_codon:yes stop_codon:yes gene_type:complete
MEDPRKLLKNHSLKYKPKFIIDENDKWDKYILSSIIETIYYVIADYIKKERKESNIGMGHLEIKYNYTDDFENTEDVLKYLDENRDVDDTNLVIFIYDHIPEMTHGKHRRILLYLANMLYFDL